MQDNIVKKEIQRVEEELKDTVDFAPFKEILQKGVQELNSLSKDDIVSFGYDWLDEKLTGILPSDLVVIGGETGTGKTTFATNIIYKASEKHRCAVFALEDRLNDYAIKAVYFEVGKIRGERGHKANYPWNDYRRNQVADQNYHDYQELAVENLTNENIYFADVKKQMTIEMLEEAIYEQVALGTKLFLIDHLHYFDLNRGSGSKADYIEEVMTRMKRVQAQTGARILLVVHYKKLGGMKPTMDSFKDSSAIAQNANYTIHLWRDRSEGVDEEDRYKTLMYIPKARNPNGEGTFELRFNKEINDYERLSETYGSGSSKEPQTVFEKDIKLFDEK